MTDSLLESKKLDGFTHESPVRAFTDFQVAGMFAIGKGFRPSLQHLATYLNAMEAKEGWHAQQVLLGAEGRDPTIIFHRCTLILDHDAERAFVDAAEAAGVILPEMAAARHVQLRTLEGRGPDDPPSLVSACEEVIVEDDPVNPKHYGGTACADIGERLTANGYQVLKYSWRLGKKDDPVIELGKAIWYLDREIVLIGEHRFHRLSPDVGEDFFETRIAGQSEFTQKVAELLWYGYVSNEGMTAQKLRRVRGTIEAEKHRIERDFGNGLAI